ncbi:hypothetical protein C8Q76DRAFT_695446 [Earliella scabrosa]|nr:hypothetical protein C8Q76DRAFT_695446 [Earliella scabrosa]
MPGDYDSAILMSKIQEIFDETYQKQLGPLPSDSGATLLSGSALKPQFKQFAARDPRILDEIFNQPERMYTVSMVAARFLEYKAAHDSTRDDATRWKDEDSQDGICSDTQSYLADDAQTAGMKLLSWKDNERYIAVQDRLDEIERRVKNAEDTAVRIEGIICRLFRTLNARLLQEVARNHGTHLKAFETTSIVKLEELVEDLRSEMLSCIEMYLRKSGSTTLSQDKSNSVTSSTAIEAGQDTSRAIGEVQDSLTHTTETALAAQDESRFETISCSTTSRSSASNNDYELGLAGAQGQGYVTGGSSPDDQLGVPTLAWNIFETTGTDARARPDERPSCPWERIMYMTVAALLIVYAYDVYTKVSYIV